MGQHFCNHGEDAGVICEGTVAMHARDYTHKL